jgi:hypothetical protein
MPMMTEPRAKAAHIALQKAIRLEKSATPVERDLIEALRARYSKPVAPDPSNTGPVLGAYAPRSSGAHGQISICPNLALASTDQLPEARKTLEQLRALNAAVAKDTPAGNNTLANVLNLAYTVSLAKVRKRRTRARCGDREPHGGG